VHHLNLTGGAECGPPTALSVFSAAVGDTGQNSSGVTDSDGGTVVEDAAAGAMVSRS
jgi:hypothetical protein